MPIAAVLQPAEMLPNQTVPVCRFDVRLLGTNETAGAAAAHLREASYSPDEGRRFWSLQDAT